MITLAEPQWTERERAHRARVAPWVEGRLARRRRGLRHPVDDFLFEYYPYSAAKLLAWHPGQGVALAGPRARRFLADRHYREGAVGVYADPSRAGERGGRVRLALAVLEGVRSRAPSFSCFGMHEWAMVYGQSPEAVRHAATPLRLAPADIRRAVDEVGLRCTHFDAFRFFTREASPLNRSTPTRENQPEMEQGGCVHANMDLYKYAMWCAPYLPGELTADAFLLARRAREIDMRASPYDLRALGYRAIPVETPEGRREYAAEQRALAEAAEGLRSRLLEAVRALALVLKG